MFCTNLLKNTNTGIRNNNRQKSQIAKRPYQTQQNRYNKKNKVEIGKCIGAYNLSRRKSRSHIGTVIFPLTDSLLYFLCAQSLYPCFCLIILRKCHHKTLRSLLSYFTFRIKHSTLFRNKKSINKFLNYVQTLEIPIKNLYINEWSNFRDEVCRKTTAMSTEGVKLSGASRAGATVNGSTLWRHPDKTSRGPKVQHVHYFCTGISQASGQRSYHVI